MIMCRRLSLIIAQLLCALSLCAQSADLKRWHQRVDPIMEHVRQQPDWLLSRLQMYWHSHATDVWVRGEVFDRPAGKRAPSATVKFNGQRSTASDYNLPRLEDVIPYDDDSLGYVTYVSKLSGRMEKTHPAKTGCNVNTLNRRIVDIARDAARIYQATGDTAYASLAFGVFDTYMRGIYYRNVPIDQTHGHMQTLVGMQTFEVIHEDIVVALTEIYRLLRSDYISRNHQLYEDAFRKWADNIIAGGVPHNNWNLFQARFVVEIAEALRSDNFYADGRGREYYMDCVLHRSSIRQWSMKRLADYGYDSLTGIWAECPGYGLTVLNEFTDFANVLDRRSGIDLFAQLPVLRRALFASPQYLFPNRMFVGFGDTHPSYLNPRAAASLNEYAQRHSYKALSDSLRQLSAAIAPKAPVALVEQYVSPSFYAPNVSWLIQRTGMHPMHDLSISLNGSLGNHQHANGISMELYGKGYVLGPDAGIGKHLYSGDDYKEYYSQFPAHNTVCVDGVSSYPVMMSQHAFRLIDRFPSSNDYHQFVPVTYAQVAFIEPETQAEQVRTSGIVKTSATGGYYIDVFRSRKVAGDDKMHDYFYHNLGQQLTLTDAADRPLPLQPTDEFAFAGGHLYAYSYIYDAQGIRTAADVKATFLMNDTLRMTLWMAGSADRQAVRALAPENRGYERMPNQPHKIDEQPTLTFIARQYGEAWERPFVAVYEPSTDSEPSEIQRVEFFRPRCKDASAVGIAVHLRNGQTDYIFSNTTGAAMSYQGMKVKGSYAVITPRYTLEKNTLKNKQP